MSEEKIPSLKKSLKERVIFHLMSKEHPESKERRDEMIKYCGDAIAREFSHLLPSGTRAQKEELCKNKVSNFIETGSSFFVMTLEPLTEGQKEQWIGLFQLQPLKETPAGGFLSGLKWLDGKGEPAHLRNVIIEKSFRGMGLGSVLMQAVREKSKELGYSLVSLDIVNPSLEQFYLKGGARGVEYQQEGRRGKTGAIALDAHQAGSGFPLQKFLLWADAKPVGRGVDRESKTQGENKETKTPKRHPRRHSM